MYSTTRAGILTRRLLNTNRHSFISISNRCISTTLIRYNNATEIDKLNALLKQKMTEIEEAERIRKIADSKPKLSDFKRPLLLTFVIASTAYLSFHWLWWTLIYDEKEQELKLRLKQAEENLEKVRNSIPEYANTEQNQKNNGKRWYHKIKFW